MIERSVDESSAGRPFDQLVMTVGPDCKGRLFSCSCMGAGGASRPVVWKLSEPKYGWVGDGDECGGNGDDDVDCGDGNGVDCGDGEYFVSNHLVVILPCSDATMTAAPSVTSQRHFFLSEFANFSRFRRLID